MELFVAMVTPYHGDSGDCKILGVYADNEKAEARCYRYSAAGNYQPTLVVKVALNVDLPTV